MLRRWFSRNPTDPPVGGVYRWRADDGSYAVLKVLAVDKAAIHIRMYSNRYAGTTDDAPDGLELIGLGPDFGAPGLRSHARSHPRL